MGDVSVPGPMASGVHGYQHGTPYVREDGWKYLHRGEAVTPAYQNTVNHYNLHLTTSAPYEPIVQDFKMMESWA